MIISFILEMGACMNAQRAQNKKPPKQPSEVQSDISPLQEYLVFEETNKHHKKCTQQEHQSTPKAINQHHQKVSLSLLKKNPTSPISGNQEAGEYELPKEIVEFIQSSQKRSIMREKEMDNQNKKLHTSKKTIYVSNSEILDFSEKNFSIQSSLITQLLEEQSEYEIVPTDANRIYESKFQRQLLSTGEFKAKLQKIELIEEQPAKLFKFESQLGKGSMCRVYRASCHMDPSKCYAVRIISIEHQKILQKLKEEITVMTLCQSYNIIKYHFSYYFQKTLFMFIEYMDYGALNHFIAHYGKMIEERVIAYVIREILKGLHSIHKRRQVHRDLKSDNILINRKGDIKIGDFGYAIQLTKDSQSSRQIAGTPAWMAPQLIKKEEYTESVDIWSLGIILVELCQGEPKYLKLDPYMAMIMIVTKSPETVTDRSVSLQNFLSRCLQKDPQQRATTKQLLSDPFIVSIGEGKVERQTFLSMLRKVPYNFY